MKIIQEKRNLFQLIMKIITNIDIFVLRVRIATKTFGYMKFDCMVRKLIVSYLKRVQPVQKQVLSKSVICEATAGILLTKRARLNLPSLTSLNR
ncbi:hypothetical protein B7992_15550 [Fibrobacter sp. UWH1]|nr:hypothetical protein B7992_15550 [Fibrobacter sp. UWH1]